MVLPDAGLQPCRMRWMRNDLDNVAHDGKTVTGKMPGHIFEGKRDREYWSVCSFKRRLAWKRPNADFFGRLERESLPQPLAFARYPKRAREMDIRDRAY